MSRPRARSSSRGCSATALAAAATATFDGDIKDGADVYHDNYAQLIPADPCYPQPDVYDGAKPISIVKVVHDALVKVIQPSSSQPQGPIAPNFHF